MEKLPDSWKTFLEGYTDMSALENTLQWVESRRQEYEVYPPAGSIFRAFELTPPEQVRAVMASKSQDGKTQQVKALIQKYGADKLSGVQPEKYADLLLIGD